MLYNASAAQDYHDLFLAAENELLIFTGKDDMNYADEFIMAASIFLRRPGRTLKIACQCGTFVSQCHILKSIVNDPARKGDIMLYDAREFRYEPYFILADTAGYRIEIPEQAETIIDYGDQKEINRLHGQFHQILSLAALKKIPPRLHKAS